ncbi:MULTISPECIES: ionic transporter [unclassified Mesorhizobium]|uniref:calcium:proton antiporter n=1 Tax=unclassified Mesorhizobium TaxID=325217 RepID=UPI001127F787|nr:MULTISPECIES: ionic transporter [unclassified Mesorhizobium]MBZ9959733.1 ionic transporter [Mesorhizobium sp. BR1-1-14]MBZ9983139.1 ionic transporter [Mesorhizobium sp. BR-1-1-8]TPI53664.1 ionic transporter [Mesorhizobium sp. B3-1-1]TPJ69249.1 ionic transporter [Mesorhizobium sp. B2-6-7]TPJ86661.1 ionic transporter [Mesorhizobium sp. B2-6-3]
MTYFFRRRSEAMTFGLPVVCCALALILQSNIEPIEDYRTAIVVIVAGISIVLTLATVFAVLRHAEAIARRVGQPYGTLVLTLAVTTIEVSIIVSMMRHGANNPTLARESVFSTVMIVCTGIVGMCLTLGGWRHRHQDVRRQGTSSFLSVLTAITVLTMVLPNYTLATSPGTFSPTQLAFVALLSLLLYGSFVFAQSYSQKEDFLEVQVRESAPESHSPQVHGVPTHFVFLLLGLVGIVLLTERVAAGVEDGLTYLQIPQSDAIVGAMIAFVVLLPEAISAIKASWGNELQRALNVALGSACATIGLTIPAVAAASLITGKSLNLGLGPSDVILLVLALAVSVVSFSTGRTTVLTGLAHLVVFVAYVLLIAVP